MNFVPVLVLLVVSAFWGSHAVVGKSVEHMLSPYPLTVWRYTFGALLYLPLAGRVRRAFRLPRGQFWLLAVAGVSGSVLYPLVYYASLHYLSPVENLLLVNTSPILAAIFGWLVLRERQTSHEWVGILISFVGVAILVAGQWTSGASILGVVLGILSAAGFATYTVSSRSLFRSLPLFDVLVITSFWGALSLWIITWITGRAGQAVHALATLPANGWAQLLYIVFVVSTLAYVLYGFGLSKVSAGIGSATTFYPQVLFAAALQWVWLGIVPSVLTGVSAVFILTGTALTSRGAVRRVESDVSV